MFKRKLFNEYSEKPQKNWHKKLNETQVEKTLLYVEKIKSKPEIEQQLKN